MKNFEQNSTYDRDNADANKNETDISAIAASSLTELGIPSSSDGFKYLHSSIVLCINQSNFNA